MGKQDRKSVLITGAAKRIGKQLALSLARHGWAVGVHYATSKDEATAVVNEIVAAGGEAIAMQADLADAGAVERLVPDAATALGPLNALINNASLFERDTAHDLTRTSWDRHINTNLRAPALLMRDFANQTQFQAGPQAGPQAGRSSDYPENNGCIINITDQRVWRLTPHFTSYTVAKAGLWTLTQTFAQALAPLRIRVNAIAPGPTLPNPHQQQSEFDNQASLVPLGHGATPDDIAHAALYILQARTMTGQTIALDGGQHLAWQTPDVVNVT